MIGIDVTPNQLTLLQLVHRRSGYTIEQAVERQLKNILSPDGKIKSWEDLRLALAQLVTDLGIKGMPAAISLPANLVHMQHIQLPDHLLDVDIAAEISAQMQRDLPGMTDELYIDFIKYPSNQKEQIEVFFAATRKEYVMSYADCINQSGLKIKVVDIDVYALMRAIHFELDEKILNQVNAIIYYTGYRIIFFIREKSGISFHQRADIFPEENIVEQLLKKIELFLTSFHSSIIQNIILCGSHKEMETLQASIPLKWQMNAYWFKHFSRLVFTVAAQEKRVVPENFLLAYGLAMNRLPPW